MLAKTKEKDVIDQLLDQIDFHGMSAEELAGENGLLKKLTSRFYSKVLDAEMDEHLGYKKNDNAGDNSGNSHKIRFSIFHRNRLPQNKEVCFSYKSHVLNIRNAVFPLFFTSSKQEISENCKVSHP